MLSYICHDQLRSYLGIVELEFQCLSIELSHIIHDGNIDERIRTRSTVTWTGQGNESASHRYCGDAQIINPMIVRDSTSGRAETKVPRLRSIAEEISINGHAVIIEIEGATFID